MFDFGKYRNNTKRYIYIWNTDKNLCNRIVKENINHPFHRYILENINDKEIILILRNICFENGFEFKIAEKIIQYL